MRKLGITPAKSAQVPIGGPALLNRCTKVMAPACASDCVCLAFLIRKTAIVRYTMASASASAAAWLAAHGTRTDAMWRELGSLGVHGLLKSVLHEGVPEGFRKLRSKLRIG